MPTPADSADAVHYPHESETVVIPTGSGTADSPSDDEWRSIGTVLRRVSLLRVRDPHDAEDLVQETFLTMIAKQGSTELEKGPLVWGLGILRNKIGNYYRRKRHESTWLAAAAPDRPSPEHRAPDACPEAGFLGVELAGIVLAYLEELSSSERDVLALLVEGFGVREIADSLHPKSYQSIASRLCRGRKKIARRLSALGYTRRGRHPYRFDRR